MEDVADGHADGLGEIAEEVITVSGSDDKRLVGIVWIKTDVVYDLRIGDVVFFEVTDDFDVFCLEATDLVFGSVGDEMSGADFVNTEEMGFFVGGATDRKGKHIEYSYDETKNKEEFFDFPLVFFGDIEDDAEDDF